MKPRDDLPAGGKPLRTPRLVLGTVYQTVPFTWFSYSYDKLYQEQPGYSRLDYGGNWNIAIPFCPNTGVLRLNKKCNFA